METVPKPQVVGGVMIVNLQRVVWILSQLSDTLMGTDVYTRVALGTKSYAMGLALCA